MTKTANSTPAATPPIGRIDIHSHMLPGIDDGCMDVEQSIESVAMLKQAGFVGSVCTPHFWPDTFPHITVEHVEIWTNQLRKEFADRGVDYLLWTGGELRLHGKVIDWLKSNEIPTLADSRYVLVDMWEDKWPRYPLKACEWLLSEGYQPILAHPERLGMRDAKKWLDGLNRLTDAGVLLQGNFRCMTGEEGYLADQYVRQLMSQDRYHLLAMDMHRPEALPGRLDGMHLVEQEFGAATLDHLSITAPRKIVFGLD